MIRLIHADVIDGLRQLATASVHCVVTSPPYWGLRNYGIEPSVWGGLPSCAHQWGDRERGRRADTLPFGETMRREQDSGTNAGGQSCTLCGSWLGCLGLEPTLQLYVEHLVDVFRHVRRVLHPSGTVWLNLGDCYVTHPHGDGPSTDPKYPAGRDRSEGNLANRKTSSDTGLKSKDLCMIPARVALALQGDGWFLRSQIPWLKRNGMPESCPDRPTSMVEYIFLLSPNESYFYDRVAVMLPQAEHERTRRLREQGRGLDTRCRLRRDDEQHGQGRPGANGVAKSIAARQALARTGVRARRNSDWFLRSLSGLLADPAGDPLALLVNPQPFGFERCQHCAKIYSRAEFRKLDRTRDVPVCRICGASKWLSHFATFPEAMVEPCILAGTSAHGACRYCGAPWERIVDKTPRGDLHRDQRLKAEAPLDPPRTLGWSPSCSHPLFDSDPVVPCVVLDCFAGAGTTGLVAARLGRDFIGIERNAAYLDLARHRLRSVSSVTPPPGSPAISDPGGSFAQGVTV